MDSINIVKAIGYLHKLHALLPYPEVQGYISLAIRALEKTIPTPVSMSKYGVYFCSVCGDTVWQGSDVSHYCFRCGQKLDFNKIIHT